jgi:hypothetical protein
MESREARKCYNGNCSCFKKTIVDPITGLRVACYNCGCPTCYLTPELIQTRVNQEDKQKASPKKEKITGKKEKTTKREKSQAKLPKLPVLSDDDDSNRKRKRLPSPEKRYVFLSFAHFSESLLVVCLFVCFFLMIIMNNCLIALV